MKALLVALTLAVASKPLVCAAQGTFVRALTDRDKQSLAADPKADYVQSTMATLKALPPTEMAQTPMAPAGKQP